MTDTAPGGPGEDRDDDVRSGRCCSWCGRIESGGVWIEPTLAPEIEVQGHSVCPDCFESLLTQ